MNTQKAYRLHGYGGPEQIRLDDAPIPSPARGEVLVAVSAVGINPFDWKIREGYVRDVMPLQLPATLGVDFVGDVVRLGEAASRFAIGDRVMTMSTRLGAYAETIAVDEMILARVPEALSDIDAATLPIPALTAWQDLHAAGEVQSGMRILIHGASGTVGAFALQFAKAAGAYVIGTASAKNRDYVLGLGADAVIDYHTERFEDHARDIDLVLDFVLIGGVMDTTSRSWGVLKPGGAIVSASDPAILGNEPDGLRGYFPVIEADAHQLEMIAGLLASGRLTSKVARVFGRNELLKAMDINQGGDTTGRLIVDFKRS